MTPYETMLSESQERMLVIVRAGHEATITKIFEKWDLPCALIGRVTDDGFMRVKNHGVTVAEIPAKKLADEAPLYKREAKRSASLDEKQKLDLACVPEVNPEPALLQLLASPDIASKRWVYRLQRALRRRRASTWRAHRRRGMRAQSRDDRRRAARADR